MAIARWRQRFLDTLAAHQDDILTRAAPYRARVSASRSRKRERGTWQRRFWEKTIRNDGDFARHMDYTHFNPIKHSYVERVQDWPFSSFHRMVRLGRYPPESAVHPGDEPERSFGER